jgi:hypothetical protein
MVFLFKEISLEPLTGTFFSGEFLARPRRGRKEKRGSTGGGRNESIQLLPHTSRKAADSSPT